MSELTPPPLPARNAVVPIPRAIDTTAKLVKEESDEVFVAASTLEEMNLAQSKLIAWADKKLEKIQAETVNATENLEIARSKKWSTEPFKKLITQSRKRYEFYEKVRAALKAGYTIIPDMPMDIFAIRTSNSKPRRNIVSGNSTWGDVAVRDQESNNPTLGIGKYVSPRAEVEREYYEVEKEGKKVSMQRAWATEFDESIDFPFKTAKIVVLNATAKALSQKLFDEIGSAPSKNVGSRGDPMVIGRIFYGNSRQQKGISFLISWFIDSKDL